MYLVVTKTELTEQFPALTVSSGSVWKDEMLLAPVGQSSPEVGERETCASGCGELAVWESQWY